MIAMRHMRLVCQKYRLGWTQNSGRFLWSIGDVSKHSATNRTNRDKQKMGHTSGRRSHPQVRHQMTIENGDEPDRIKLFKKTHTKKSGEIVDSTSSYIIEQMDERLSQIPGDEQTPNSLEDVFTQILGKDRHDKVRMGGLGTCPTKVRQKQQYQVPQEQYDQMRAQITAELEEKFQAQIQSQVQMQVRAILEAMGHTPPAPDNTPQPRQLSSHASASAAHVSTPSLEAECIGLSTPECGHNLEVICYQIVNILKCKIYFKIIYACSNTD
ncbi:uncharacterized protein LOC127787120 [Diospyros lotus]|uniref:uncharacterized protein LOC127787120 n=1 Tax=Diospyros lotus TaxID=55363 RepID=UPI0022552FD7|nr:uncharacterized protein LOC127787120 [Diospyros lotus]